MKIESVLIDVLASSANAAALLAGYKLPEEAEGRAKMKITVDQITLHQVVVIAVRIGGGGARVRIVDELVTLPHLSAERQKPILLPAKGNVLDRVPEVGASAGVF